VAALRNLVPADGNPWFTSQGIGSGVVKGLV
jgi:hypothetical protein